MRSGDDDEHELDLDRRSRGTTERLTFDQRTGLLAPGASLESNIPEIEVATSLGDATDTIVLYLTEGDDVVAQGQNGLAMNADGDLDVTVSPGAFPMEIYALGGNDIVNARGLQRRGPRLPGAGRSTEGKGTTCFAAPVDRRRHRRRGERPARGA